LNCTSEKVNLKTKFVFLKGGSVLFALIILTIFGISVQSINLILLNFFVSNKIKKYWLFIWNISPPYNTM